MELAEQDSGRSVTAPFGERVYICLPEVASTGYLWQMVATGGQADVEVKTEQPPTGVTGGGVTTRCFRLRYHEPGRYAIHLARFRPWESADRADSTFEAIVTLTLLPPRHRQGQPG